MIVKRRGGMTEFIPSPQEKREGLIRDHALDLARLLHDRLVLIEETLGIPSQLSEQCQKKVDSIAKEEAQVREDS